MLISCLLYQCEQLRATKPEPFCTAITRSRIISMSRWISIHGCCIVTKCQGWANSLWRPILLSKLPLQGKKSYCEKAFCKTRRFPHGSGARLCPLFLVYYCPPLVTLRSGSFTLCCKPTAPLCAPETDRNVSLPVLIVAWSLATREGHTQPHSLFPG